MASHCADQGAFASKALALLHEFGQFGKTAGGGITRLAASQAEKEARDHLCRWLKEHGFTVLIDAIGNIFGVLDLGARDNERAFFCGSHLDSQPNGGNYDGCLGVVSASVAALFLRAKTASKAIRPAYRYYVVTCWTGEEGARFQPSLIGSSVFTGALKLADAWGLCDGDGIRLKDALSATGYLGSDPPPRPDFYLELHIEQGARLEAAGAALGLVEACWGVEKCRLVIQGKADHTGPTPMRERRNALLAAARVVLDVEAIASEARAELYSSVGRMALSPNSPNTVVARAELWIEFRSASKTELQRARDRLADSLTHIGGQTGCKLSITGRETRAVTRFDEAALARAGRALADAGIAHQRLHTIAGHDAIRLQSVCPAALLFVPSKDGVSHSPAEFTTDADVRAGFEAMTIVLSSLIAEAEDDSCTGRSAQ